MFDLSEVTLYGMVFPPYAGRDAVARLETPNTYTVGFPSGVQGTWLVGSQLYYATGNIQWKIWKFVPEYASSTRPTLEEYPEDPQTNDVAIETPPCYGGDDGPDRLLGGPSGELVYRCSDGVWYEQGRPFYSGSATLDVIGNNRLAVVDGTQVMNLETGEIFPRPPGLPPHLPLGFRALTDGFYVVIRVNVLGSLPELWKLNSDGTGAKLGVYPSVPSDVKDAYNMATLTLDGSMFQMLMSGENDVVVRRSIDGTSEVVYTEASDPILQLHVAKLLTGP